MKLPNPPDTHFEYEDDEYGYRTSFDQEEIVNKRTGESNMRYYKPEMVLNPKGCKHEFEIVDIRKREFSCKRCHWAVTVNIPQIIENDEGDITGIQLHNGKWKVK